MGPRGLLIVVTVIVAMSASEISTRESATREQANLTQQLMVTSPGSPRDLECPPGHYENNEACSECDSENDRCEDARQCCGSPYLECRNKSESAGKCKCIEGYYWSHLNSKCNESLTGWQIGIILGSTFLFSLVVFSIVYGCRKRTTRCLQEIRERREAQHGVQHLRMTTIDEDHTRPAPRGDALSLSDVLAAQYDETSAHVPHHVSAHVPVQPPIDLPPHYSQISPISVSPPPNYSQATEGFSFPPPDQAAVS